ncbi:hypothetical protein [Brevibacillus sp. 179-C 1.1 NHS]|uniref:hypothetical protein n=1 Tax=Brevibacillus sp. 179-C 1.1 NHS TaxID=3235177 RepID=UPI0039A3438B
MTPQQVSQELERFLLFSLPHKSPTYEIIFKARTTTKAGQRKKKKVAKVFGIPPKRNGKKETCL